jgi:chromosome segregation protein
MEATEGNLSRLNDIIQEIEKNLASLERQAQKARQYKKYKEELLDKEMTWGRRKSQVFQQKLESLKKQRDALEQELVGMRAQLQTAENSIEVDRVELVTETKEAETLQARIQDLSSDLSHEKSALELSRRRQGDLAAQLESLESEQEELTHSLETDRYRLEENQTQGKEADELFQQAAIEVKQMNERLSQLRSDASKARSHLESTQRELMKGMTEASNLTSKAAALLSKAESARAQASRLALQIESQNEKIIGIQEEYTRLQETAEEVKGQKEQLQAEKKDQSGRLQSDEQELRRLEKSRDESHRALTQLKSRLLSLEELDQSHEGLADGPKAALDWAKGNGKGQQLKALTDTLEVANGYESVLESWLENRIENLILQEPELALPLFEQIKKDKQGRVSIQLISKSLAQLGSDSEKSFADIKTFLESQGFQVLGTLSQFVQGKADYAQTLSHLVSQVCVVESSAPAMAFIQNPDFSKLAGWSIVSMDGVAIEPNGILRGGSLDASGAVGILKRKRAIEELKTQVSGAEVQHQALEETLSQAKQKIELARARLQTLQSDLQALEVQSAGLQRDVHQTDRALQEARIHLESLEQDSHEISQEAEQALSDREAIDLELKEFMASRSDLETSIAAAESALQEKEELVHAQDAELQTVRVKEASLRERAVSLKREFEATRSLIADRERRLAEIKRTLERATREQEQYTGGESELAEKIEELTLSLSNARDQLAAVKDRMEQYNAKVNSTLEKIKSLHKSGDQKTADSNQLALEIEKLSGELSHLVQNLEEKYGPGCLDRPVASNHSDNGEDVNIANLAIEMTLEEEITLGEEVERLRERIRRLGEVNVMAIEEYEQMKKRFDHLLGEKADLELSLTNLQDAIEHINRTSIERFKKAFEAIADRFERLFPIIFGGGQARLSLVYPEGSSDILEAGVDILAQPPGKKVANITLLSGGEKALTAVSLIFAIFMVKPSPFCVLDEVDAPLDDANIGKFNALLKEMSAKSQFILITHNKKTMELNDTLYGVTMEEPGVSKMVSIEMQ